MRASGRAWLVYLRKLKLPHTEALADFVFFNAGRPQAEVAAAMLAKGANIGRAYPPYTNWARITVGLSEEIGGHKLRSRGLTAKA